MISINDRVKVCHPCKERERCTGQCVCRANGKPFLDNVRAGACPLRKFEAAEIEAQLEAEGYDPVRDHNAGGCNCAP